MSDEKRLFIIFMVFLSSLLVFGVYGYLSVATPDFLMPRILRDLPKGDIRETISERIEHSFPAGTSAEAVVLGFQEMGFEVTEYAPGQYRAVFVQRQIVCSTKWTMAWSVNAEGRVTFQLFPPFWRDLGCL